MSGNEIYLLMTCIIISAFLWMSYFMLYCFDPSKFNWWQWAITIFLFTMMVWGFYTIGQSGHQEQLIIEQAVGR